MRSSRPTVFKAIDSIGIKNATNNVGAQVFLQGPSVFCGGVFQFTISRSDTNPSHGNGLITAAIVRGNGDTLKAQGGLESFNNRDVIAYRTFQVFEVYNKDMGKSYYSCNMPFVVRTRNHRRVNEQEGVAIWIKGMLNCSK